MNTKIEMNQISDETLGGVVGGSFWNVVKGVIQLGGGPIGVNVIAHVTPWGQVGNAVSSVVKHFKFW